MALEEGLDTGPVCACERLPIGVGRRRPTNCARLVAPAPTAWWRGLASGTGRAGTAAASRRRYAAKTSAARLKINWFRTRRRRCTALVRSGRAWTTFRSPSPTVLKPIPSRQSRSRRCSTACSSAPATAVASSWSRCSRGRSHRPRRRGATALALSPASDWSMSARPPPDQLALLRWRASTTGLRQPECSRPAPRARSGMADRDRHWLRMVSAQAPPPPAGECSPVRSASPESRRRFRRSGWGPTNSCSSARPPTPRYRPPSTWRPGGRPAW